MLKTNSQSQKHYSTNKQHLSANGFSLLPLALRPCLFLSTAIVFTAALLNFIFCDDTAFATDPTLSVSIANSISLELKPTSAAGNFATSDTTTNTISVTTNYFAGYTLSIAASTANDNALKYVENGTTLATLPSHSISAGVSATNYADDTYARTNELNNTWGYRPSKYNSVDNTTTNYYYPGPTGTMNTTPTVLDATSVANTETANNYNIAIGARIDTDTPKGIYTNTFVIQVVANPIPYTITYNKNTEDTVANMPSNVDTATVDTSVTVGSAPSRSGYSFVGWCTTAVADGGTCDGPSTQYAAGGSYTIDQISGENDLVLYAMWAEIPTIIFKAGNNIDAVIVADSSNKYAPKYAVGSTGEAKFKNAVVGTKYIVTVVPKANYILDSTTPWIRKNSKGEDATVGALASTTLLTTTYTVGNGSETLTANGSSSTASYTAMKDFALSGCTEAGNNVTDERDGKSYTVAKFGSYCYMLSNLRLEGGTALDSSTSNVKGAFTLPDQTTWTSSSQNHYCEARMRYIGNEYYYNWYAAKANPTTGVSSSSSCADTTRDNASLGSICPKNWTLPTYNDITAVALWDSGNNPGMLATTGTFYSGSQRSVGSNGIWWSSTRSINDSAYYLYFVGTSAGRSSLYKSYGYSVRCRRSS